ncbi:TRIC cation channel family protein [Corynebacterium sp. TA-R-1]|uniref:TRIC cation channel family protein n=1 Tax=Corynebacterium stercoris TaxID=2943490 RepID=A0ABT1G2M5_9CORY|nr:TRIC cation channel family protein [Corynebacterium stercoris]
MDTDFSQEVYTLYFVLEYIGVFLAAVVGGTIAKREEFDVVGFLVVALVSSLAGGLIRDAVLNDGPAAALQTPGYLLTASAGAVVAFVMTFKDKFWDTFRFYADVVTIGVWGVVGATRAIENDLPWISIILLGVLTAVGGSLTRDVMLGKLPSLLTEQKMLVFPAIVASVILSVFHYYGLMWQGMFAAAVAGPVVSMCVYWLSNWRRRQVGLA